MTPIRSPKKVCVVGLGYVGLPTAAMFAARKVHVVGVDKNPTVVETVNRGSLHIVEPELDILVHATTKEGYLRAALVPEPADAFLIAVPTPLRSDLAPDLSYIEAAAQAIAPVLQTGSVVILESTSPVGSTEKLCEWLADLRPDLRFPHLNPDSFDVSVAYCPERVLPGHVVRELVENDRVIGGLTPRCSEHARLVYKTFVQGKLFVTNARTAEMCKLTENAFRDLNIAFANELSTICDRAGIDAWELIRLANRHPRVNILQPGCGVGGHCIAVDPWFIVHGDPEQARLIHQARKTNDAKPLWVVDKIRDAMNAFTRTHKREPALAILGLAFKPNIDDLRNSPACQIAEIMSEHTGADLMVVEPNITSLPPSLTGCSLVTAEQAIAKADIVAVLVGHQEFPAALSQGTDKQIVLDMVGLRSAG